MSAPAVAIQIRRSGAYPGLRGGAMATPEGKAESGALRLDFDRRLTLSFRGSVVSPNAGRPTDRVLDDAVGSTALAGEVLTDAPTGENGRHAPVGLLRWSVFGHPAGYVDVNGAGRMRLEPALDRSGTEKIQIAISMTYVFAVLLGLARQH